MKSITVIVSKCRRLSFSTESAPWTPNTFVSYELIRVLTFYPLNSEDVLCFARAADEAQVQRNKGISVILRPNYNEADDKGLFFREWRSFDGGPLEEVIFRF